MLASTNLLKRSVISWLCWLLLVAYSTGQGLSANLVVNGSFEDWGSHWRTQAGKPFDSSLAVGEAWRTPNGSNFAVVTHYIGQDIPTVAGQSYLVRFAFGGNERYQVNSGPLYVLWGNQELGAIPVAPVDWRHPRWRYFDFIAQAASNITRISFSTKGKDATPYIDDIQVTAVPGTFLAIPQDQSVEVGAAVVFKARMISRPQETTYQWFFQKTNALVGATNEVLKLTDIRYDQAGLYTVSVSNASITATSSPGILTVIPSLNKRTVPVIWASTALNGSKFPIEYTDDLGFRWLPLVDLVQSNGRVFYIDRSPALLQQRFYRVRNQSDEYSPLFWMDATTAIYLSGRVGDRIRVDFLDAIGTPDAWQTLDTVTLDSTNQWYASDAMLGKIGKLYRIVPVPGL